jgi:hypothetical protein
MSAQPLSTAMYPGIKISALPDADVPLAGTETIPIVQDGITKQVAASDVAAAGGGVLSGAVLLTGVATGRTSGWHERQSRDGHQRGL